MGFNSGFKELTTSRNLFDSKREVEHKEEADEYILKSVLLI